MGERSTAVCYLEIYKVCHFYVNRNYIFDEIEYQTACIPIDVNFESVVIFGNETTKRSTTKNFFSKY